MNQVVRDKATDREPSSRKVPESLSIVAVAQSSIAKRIADVRECFNELNAGPENTADTVHRLRVACRRATTCLDFFNEIFDGAARRRFTLLLRNLRRKAGDVRDIDVLSERIQAYKGRSARKLLDSFRSRREARAQKLLNYGKKVSLELPSLAGDVLSLLMSKNQEAVFNDPFRPWGVERVADTAQGFLKALRKADRSAKSLHRARIAGKKLRYSLEILEPVIPEVAASPASCRLRKFQNLVGDIHDRLVQRKSLRRQAEKIGTSGVRRFVKNEIQKGKRQVRKDLASLYTMCSNDEIRALSRDLGELMDEKS